MNEEQIREAMKLYENKQYTFRGLGERFNVSRMAVWRALNEKNHKYNYLGNEY